MAFDEQGQAATLADKIRICERAYRILVDEVGFPPKRRSKRELLSTTTRLLPGSDSCAVNVRPNRPLTPNTSKKPGETGAALTCSGLAPPVNPSKTRFWPRHSRKFWRQVCTRSATRLSSAGLASHTI